MRRKKEKEQRVLKSLNIGIAGLGLIGASLAMRLSENKAVNIIGCDTDKETLTTAFDKGIIHLGHTDPAILRGCEVIFVAVPVDKTIQTIKLIYQAVGNTAVITDMTSVKSAVIELLPAGIRFVGGHPMAGSEKSGISAAQSGLFEDCRYILTRAPATTAADFEFVRELVIAIGAVPVEAGAEEHDGAAAALSHLPHIIAYSLVSCVPESELCSAIASSSFRDMTRIAASSPQFWRGVAELNSVMLLENNELFRKRLDEITGNIKRGDFDAAEQFFAAAQEKKLRINGVKSK